MALTKRHARSLEGGDTAMETLKRLFTKPRLLRLAAFGIDCLVFLLIVVLSINLTGKPDYITAQKELELLKQPSTAEEAQAQTLRAVDAFNDAYSLTLWLWIGSEVLFQFIFQGQSLGKKLCRLRIVSAKGRGRLVTNLCFTLRSFLKVLLLYLFRGLPFVIALAYLFADPDNRTGYDRICGTKVIQLPKN